MSDETPPGCQHREHKAESTCNKLCDPGQTLCPHHKLLAQSKAEEKEAKAKPTSRARKPHKTSRASVTPIGYSE